MLAYSEVCGVLRAVQVIPSKLEVSPSFRCRAAFLSLRGSVGITVCVVRVRLSARSSVWCTVQPYLHLGLAHFFQGLCA